MLPTHLECPMTARTLAQPFPTVTPDTDAMDAAQTMARLRWPGLIISGDDGRPYTILPGSEVLRFLIPTYVPVSYTHLRAHETDSYLVCRLLLEKKKYSS